MDESTVHLVFTAVDLCWRVIAPKLPAMASSASA
jgi:hypothetical protein